MTFKEYIAKAHFKWNKKYNGLKFAKVFKKRILTQTKRYATWWALEVNKLVPLAEIHLPNANGSVIDPEIIDSIIEREYAKS